MKLRNKKSTVINTTASTIITTLDSVSIASENLKVLMSTSLTLLKVNHLEVQAECINDLIAIGYTKAQATQLIKDL